VIIEEHSLTSEPSFSPERNADSTSDETPEEDYNTEVQLVSAHRETPEPCIGDELLFQTLVTLMGSETAERYSAYVDHHNNVYVKVTPLPEVHYLSPSMYASHQAAMTEAIQERATELNCSPAVVRGMTGWDASRTGTRDRRGFRDTSPRLIPGNAFHERLATEDPDLDDDREYPGFRAQALGLQTEHIATVTRPDALPSVGVADQPRCKIKEIACLTVRNRLHTLLTI
jgi:hypothetical protein